MYSQIKLIDNVLSFSPARESWVDKPVGELPKKLTDIFTYLKHGMDLKRFSINNVWLSVNVIG